MTTKHPGVAGELEDRRPLRTRTTRPAEWAARFAIGLGLTPNTISVLGLIAGLAAGMIFLAAAQFPEHAPLMLLAGAFCVQLRLLANMLDGMVAVATGATSAVGELYNEVPDRISDSAALVGFGYASGVPLLGWGAACIALFVAYVRAIGKAAGTHQEFCGPMAKPQRMFLITVGALSLALLPESWLGAFTLGTLDFPALLMLTIVVGGAVTAGRRIRRIANALNAKGNLK